MSEKMQQDQNIAVDSQSQINLTKDAEIIERSWGRMLCINVKGEFSKTAMPAWRNFWKEVHGQKLEMGNFNTILSFSHIDFTKEGDDKFTFLAGALVNKEPDNVQDPLEIMDTGEGKYAKYTLKGSYSQLEQAWQKAFQQAQEVYTLRNCFCAEVYVNSPTDTDESELLTDLYIPIE